MSIRKEVETYLAKSSKLHIEEIYYHGIHNVTNEFDREHRGYYEVEFQLQTQRITA